jgi:hypothetical protein
LDFGADTTGTNSSRNALIAAIAACPNNGIVYLPKGTYSGIYSISITKPISIVGDGSNLTIIDTPDFDVGGNNASPIFSLQAGCTLFKFQDLKLQWEGGLSLGKGRSEGIINQSNIPSSCEVFVINVVFRNIAEGVSMWRGKISKLFVDGCSFYYKHGYASCRNGLLNPPTNWWEADVGIAGWPIVGNARYTYIRNNEFNGCEDFTFTGVPENCPEWLKTPVDNFFKSGGRPYDVHVIENNIIRNYGVEGIILEQTPLIGSWLNENDGYNISQAVIKGNTIIGPERVSIYSRGVTPAISVYDANKISITGNYISNGWSGIVAHGVQTNTVTASSANNNFTITYRANFHIYPNTNNGSSIRFSFKGNGDTAGGGVEVGKQYYVVNAEELSGGGSPTRVFQLSETLNGSPITITSNIDFSRIIGESEWQNQQILIDSNVITGCVNGIVAIDISHKHIHVLNNYICVESEPCKTAQGYWSDDTTQDPPPDATDLRPITGYHGGITVEKNIIQFGETKWDGIFDFVSRTGANNNIITLGAGQVAELAALRETADDTIGTGVGSPVLYNGFFTVWNENSVYRWPIDSIDVDNNTVTISAGWATNNGADTFTSGKMYWTTNRNWAPHAFIFNENPLFGTIISKDNIVINASEDFRYGGTRPTEIQSNNDSFRDLQGALQKYLSHIVRKNQFSLLDVLQGNGTPIATAPNGSLYLRTDGDASTTLYVRANGAWEPLAAY